MMPVQACIGTVLHIAMTARLRERPQHGPSLSLSAIALQAFRSRQSKGRANNAHVLTAEHFLHLPHTKHIADLMLLIRQEQVGQTMFIDESGVRFWLIRANPNDNCACLLQSTIIIPEAASFFGTGWGHILRVEKKHDLATAKIT